MISLRAIADLTGGQIVGNPDLEINGVCEIQNGVSGSITFLSNPKYNSYAVTTEASAIITADKTILAEKDGIVVENPQLAIARVLEYFHVIPATTPVTHETAVIADSAVIAEDVSIGPNVVIEENARINTQSIVGANTIIGAGATIGTNCTLHSNIHVYHSCSIGDHCRIFSGTVIGSDGFGYVKADGKYHKIPQTGRVYIGDNVDIGANCTIDRGTIGDTVIGAGSKLDNLVHIAHNVMIGKGCLLAAGVGIAGSAVIGDFCIFAGHSGVVPHVQIGEHAVFAVKSGATKSLPGNTVYSGMPAREIKEQNKKDAVMTEISAIKKRLHKLENDN